MNIDFNKLPSGWSPWSNEDTFNAVKALFKSENKPFSCLVASKASKVVNFKIHTLRAVCAINAVLEGKSNDSIMAMQGWKDAASLSRYLRWDRCKLSNFKDLNKLIMVFNKDEAQLEKLG